MYRYSAPLIFANSEAFKDGANNLLIDAGARNDDFDITGATTLAETVDYCDRYGVDVALAQVHSEARRMLDESGDMDEIGERNIFSTVREAVGVSTGEQSRSTTTRSDTDEPGPGSASTS